jgi:hypothetical protein
MPAGNVGQDELLHVAHSRKRGRFTCRQMSLVARNRRVAVQKRGFDHQQVRAADQLGNPSVVSASPTMTSFLRPLWRTEDAFGINHRGLALATTSGAITLDFMKEDIYERIQELTQGRGADACIDAVGTEPETKASVDSDQGSDLHGHRSPTCFAAGDPMLPQLRHCLYRRRLWRHA